MSRPNPFLIPPRTPKGRAAYRRARADERAVTEAEIARAADAREMWRTQRHELSVRAAVEKQNAIEQTKQMRFNDRLTARAARLAKEQIAQETAFVLAHADTTLFDDLPPAEPTAEPLDDDETDE